MRYLRGADGSPRVSKVAAKCGLTPDSVLQLVRGDPAYSLNENEMGAWVGLTQEGRDRADALPPVERVLTAADRADEERIRRLKGS